MAMMDYKVRSATAEMEAFHRRHSEVRMTKYPSTMYGSRPLPVAKKGQQFSVAEKELLNQEYRQKYHLNKQAK